MGLVYSINPCVIMFLVPVVGALTTGAAHFDMIHLGGYVSALAPFWMVAFSAGACPTCPRPLWVKGTIHIWRNEIPINSSTVQFLYRSPFAGGGVDSDPSYNLIQSLPN